MENTIQAIILGIDFLSWAQLVINFSSNTWYWLDKPYFRYALRRNPMAVLAAQAFQEISKYDKYTVTVQDIKDKVRSMSLDESLKPLLEMLLLEFRHIFSSRPGCVRHVVDIDVGNAKPIAQKPYRVNDIKRRQLENMYV